jgi:hypothetical protein
VCRLYGSCEIPSGPARHPLGGVLGATYTQVISGLQFGQTVVLADYSLVVPSSNTNSFGGFGGLDGLDGGGLRSRFGGASPGAFTNPVKSVGR